MKTFIVKSSILGKKGLKAKKDQFPNLYFRRLPSPPPSLLSNSNRNSPDTSEDKSESSYEDTTLMKRLNCPLCVNTFGYSFGLECHLLSVHQEELQLIR